MREQIFFKENSFLKELKSTRIAQKGLKLISTCTAINNLESALLIHAYGHKFTYVFRYIKKNTVIP